MTNFMFIVIVVIVLAVVVLFGTVFGKQLRVLQKYPGSVKQRKMIYIRLIKILCRSLII